MCDECERCKTMDELCCDKMQEIKLLKRQVYLLCRVWDENSTESLQGKTMCQACPAKRDYCTEECAEAINAWSLDIAKTSRSSFGAVEQAKKKAK